MDFSALLQRVGRTAVEKSPAILTAIGVTGTISTAYLAVRGAFQAADIIREAENKRCVENEPCLSTQDKFEATWQCYVPAVASAAMTVAAIVCANRIGERRTAALASAYSVVIKSYDEYRTKTIEKIGKKKEQDLRDEIAQDRRTRKPIETSSVIVTGKGTTYCYDPWTDRYFTSDMQSIRTAVNDFNQTVINQSYAPLAELYILLKIKPTKNSFDIGWSTDRLLEVDFSGTLDDEGVPALQMEFRNPPTPNFADFH